jgi:hypothetical protein
MMHTQHMGIRAVGAIVIAVLGMSIAAAPAWATTEDCAAAAPLMLVDAVVTTDAGMATLVAHFAKSECVEAAVFSVGLLDPRSKGYPTVDSARIEDSEVHEYERSFPSGPGRVSFALGAQGETDGALGMLWSFGTFDGIVPEPPVSNAAPVPLVTPSATSSSTATPVATPSPSITPTDLDAVPASSEDSARWAWVAIPVLVVLILGAGTALLFTLRRSRSDAT